LRVTIARFFQPQCHIQFRSKALQVFVSQSDEELVEVSRSQEIELVGGIDVFFLQPFIESLEMGSRILEFLLILRCGVGNFAVVFDFRNIDGLAFLDEKVRAKIAALGMLAFFPRVFNRIEPLGRVL
jgi:hypothetical protein